MSEVRRFQALVDGVETYMVMETDYSNLDAQLKATQRALADLPPTLIAAIQAESTRRMEEDSYMLDSDEVIQVIHDTLSAEVRPEADKCPTCLGKGLIDWNDVEAKARNGGSWGRCLTCSPYQLPQACKHEWTEESRANNWRSSCRLCGQKASGSGQ